MIVLTLVCFRPRLQELEATLRTLADCREEFTSVHVLSSGDNSDHGMVEAALKASLGASGWSLIRRYDNVGFSGGHNLLMANAFESGADCAIVINPDLEFEPGSVRDLSEFALAGERLSLIGPTLRRTTPDGTSQVDSLGIEWTADGRHVDAGQGEPWQPVAHPVVRQGVTGACLVVTREVYERVMALDEEFFDVGFVAYREDAELGIRAGALGVDSVCVPVAGISHRRAVANNARSNELVNRLSVQNRFLMKWKLGPLRPGSRGRSNARDLIVVAAAATVERSSWPGIRAAFAVRRYYKARAAELVNRRDGDGSASR